MAPSQWHALFVRRLGKLVQRVIMLAVLPTASCPTPIHMLCSFKVTCTFATCSGFHLQRHLLKELLTITFHSSLRRCCDLNIAQSVNGLDLKFELSYDSYMSVKRIDR